MKKILLCCFAMIMAMMAAISPALAADSIISPALAAGSIISPALAADSTICTEEGLFPDPDDCTKFYRCVKIDGKFTISEYSCPSGLLFNPEIMICDYRYNVPECSSNGSSSIFTPESNTSAALTEFVPGKSLS